MQQLKKDLFVFGDIPQKKLLSNQQKSKKTGRIILNRRSFFFFNILVAFLLSSSTPLLWLYACSQCAIRLAEIRGQKFVSIEDDKFHEKIK